MPNLFGDVPSKRCPDCKRVLPLNDFHYSRKNKGYPRRYAQTYCKDCSNRRCRAYYESNGDTWRRKALLRKFGISLEEYEKMLTTQDWRCAICGSSESLVRGKQRNSSQLSVDHDHVTGKTRGLLCNNCNRALGLFGDDVKLLHAAIAYLQKHTGK